MASILERLTNSSTTLVLTHALPSGLSAQEVLDTRIAAITELQETNMFNVSLGVFHLRVRAGSTLWNQSKHPSRDALEMESGSKLHIILTRENVHVKPGEYAMSPRFAQCHGLLIHAEDGLHFYHNLSGDTGLAGEMAESVQAKSPIRDVLVIGRSSEDAQKVVSEIRSKGLTVPIRTYQIDPAYKDRFRLWIHLNGQNQLAFRATTDSSANKPIGLRNHSGVQV